MKLIVLATTLIYGILYSFSQSDLYIFVGNISFENNDINGTVVTNPSGNIKINNDLNLPSDYYSPFVIYDSLKRSLLDTMNFSDKFSLDELYDGTQGADSFDRELKARKNEFSKYLQLVTIFNPDDTSLVNYLNETLATLDRILSMAEYCIEYGIDIYPSFDSTSKKIDYSFLYQDLLKNSDAIVVNSYSNGLARIKKRNKYGFLDLNGDLIIPFKFDYVTNFQNDRAIVYNNGRWYVINRKGKNKMIFNEQTSRVNFFSEGHYIVKRTNNETYIINEDWERVTKKYQDILSNDQSEYWVTFKNGKYGLIGNDLSEILKCKYKNSFVFFSNGSIKVTKAKKSEWNQGLANANGIVFRCQNLNIYDFDNFGFAKVKNCIGTDGGGHSNCYYCLIDVEGKRVSDYYTDIGSFNKFGVASVRDSEFWGLIDTSMRKISSFNYDNIYEFKNRGVAKVQNGAGKFGVIHSNGSELIPCKYKELQILNEGKFFRIKTDENTYGIINQNGFEIVPPTFLEIKYQSHQFLVHSLEEVFILDSTGNCTSNNRISYSDILNEYYSGR